jgi:hypothetical protein
LLREADGTGRILDPVSPARDDLLVDDGVEASSRWMPMLKMIVPLRAGSPFHEIPNHWPRRVTYRTVTLTGRPGSFHSMSFLNRRSPSW